MSANGKENGWKEDGGSILVSWDVAAISSQHCDHAVLFRYHMELGSLYCHLWVRFLHNHTSETDIEVDSEGNLVYLI